MNVTICAVPFSFVKGDNIRQRNAIGSWLRLDPKPEIILLGDDEGVPEFAKSRGFQHIGSIRKTKLGHMDCSDIFQKMQEAASHDVVLYMDCDTILLSSFLPVLKFVSTHYNPFMMVGGRWSIPTPAKVWDFKNPVWEEEAIATIKRHVCHGSDYYAFPKGFITEMPDFSMGRGHWDGWVMRYPLDRGAELVRADLVTKTLHQDHGPRTPRGAGSGWQRNLRLCGGKEGQRWASDATVVLKPGDLK